jgi:tetratricopeptide (TPR) repeat protein
MAGSERMNNEKQEEAGIKLLERGHLRRAERTFKQLLADDPNCLTAHFQLARVYRNTKQYKLALHHGGRTLRLNPKETNAAFNLGLTYELMGQRKLAILNYRRELALNPDNEEALWYLGRLYFKTNQWLRASRCLRRCFDRTYLDDIENTLYKLGICYNKLNDLPSYIDVYTRYLKTFSYPTEKWAFPNLGYALLLAKDYEGAVFWLSKAKYWGSGAIDDDLKRASKLLWALRK